MPPAPSPLSPPSPLSAPSRDEHVATRPPASAAHSFGPVRPDRLTVWPIDDGGFGIHVRWCGRECILRAVVVRRLLAEAGFPATAGNSIDGRTWEVDISPVPADKVAEVIETFIW